MKKQKTNDEHDYILDASVLLLLREKETDGFVPAVTCADQIIYAYEMAGLEELAAFWRVVWGFLYELDEADKVQVLEFAEKELCK